VGRGVEGGVEVNKTPMSQFKKQKLSYDCPNTKGQWVVGYRG